MPGLTGIEVLGKIRQLSPETQVVILTGHATVDTAVQALRLGAFDYLTKPCKWAELEVILNRVAERRDLTNKATALETRLKAAEGTPTLIGETPAMQAVRRLIDTIAPTDASVMILGETGTGKELIARNLHDKSRRAAHAFIPVNCGALPENLVESELFGHRKGAFTGADADRKGLFEVANGGTLFLDEVGELDKSVQVKLLRFLESGEIRRVGENDPFRVDVRVLCATNRDLREMIEAEQFREDLFFRINTFEIHLPPLRERKADIPPLARHMLTRLRLAPRRPRAGADPRGDRRARRPTTGRATSASWPTRSSGPRSSPAAARSAPSTCRPRSPRAGRRPRRRALGGRRPPLPDPRGQPHAPRHRDEVHPGHPGEAQRQQARRVQGAGDQPQDALQQDQPAPADLSARTKAIRAGAEWMKTRCAQPRVKILGAFLLVLCVGSVAERRGAARRATRRSGRPEALRFARGQVARVGSARAWKGQRGLA